MYSQRREPRGRRMPTSRGRGRRVIWGGADWDGTNRLTTAAGAGYRGSATGYTVATIFRIDAADVAESMLNDALDPTGKGWDIRQNTTTTIVCRSAKASGADWWISPTYSFVPDIGRLQMLVVVCNVAGGTLSLWASDEKVGADTAIDGFVIQGATNREAVGCVRNGTFPHTGLRWFGRGGWDRAFTDAEVHALYDAVATTGQIPLGLANQVSVCNVTANAVPPSFPSTVQNLVTPGTGDFTFLTGSAAGITLVSEVV